MKRRLGEPQPERRRRACAAPWPPGAALRRIVLALVIGVVAGAAVPAPARSADPAPTDCGAMVIARFAWPTAQLASGLVAALLRDGVGCAVKVETAAPEPARRLLAAAAADNASGSDAVTEDLDVARRLVAPAITLPDKWRQTLAPETARQLRHGPPLYGGGEVSGLFTFAWLVRATPSLTSAEAAVAQPARFARRRAARPRVYLCPRAWPCHADSRTVADRLQLAETFEVIIPASGDALTEALTRSAEAGEPWIGYYWTPSAAAARIPLAPLKVQSLQICDAGGACRAPFASAPSVIAFAPQIENDAPIAAGILRSLTLSTPALLDALSWRAANNASWEEATDYLASTYPGTWRDALPAAAQARFEEALAARLTAPQR